MILTGSRDLSGEKKMSLIAMGSRDLSGEKKKISLIAMGSRDLSAFCGVYVEYFVELILTCRVFRIAPKQESLHIRGSKLPVLFLVLHFFLPGASSSFVSFALSISHLCPNMSQSMLWFFYKSCY